MKALSLLVLCLYVSLTTAAQTNPNTKANLPDSAVLVATYGKLPLAFEANQGQSSPQVQFFVPRRRLQPLSHL